MLCNTRLKDPLRGSTIRLYQWTEIRTFERGQKSGHIRTSGHYTVKIVFINENVLFMGNMSWKLFQNLPWYMPRLHAKFHQNWWCGFREILSQDTEGHSFIIIRM